MNTTDFMQLSHAHCAMKAADMSYEIETLRRQLAEKYAEIERLTTKNLEWLAQWNKDQETIAASGKREQQYRDALTDTTDFLERHSNRWDGVNGKHPASVVEQARNALALPSDNTALREMIAKAGECMKERCRKVAFDMAYTDSMAVDMSQTIRALPGVTLEDIQK